MELLIFLVSLFLLFLLAVRLKTRSYRSSNVEAIASPASRALAELVAVAGGIYLSLVLLVSFLKIELPEAVAIGPVRVDPLAIVALLVALFQPLFFSLWPRIKGR
ncbi:hypothetical protein [Moorella sp. Hama-1]|uniref:hypothetical protein n=1 Tax=Moorella sp. Hama-1 TaxID=2138101 RepID=UPI000D643A40|nr:hypothetical protein [Moorella sp. Hama-1]MDN5361618.1 hypothetical protein [Moorella sp. (in: firmicutes)]BCV21146.1 hypothetical protein hamaS1_12150 [Moorella sp. Hama-1]